jgi:hypothetical protein
MAEVSVDKTKGALTRSACFARGRPLRQSTYGNREWAMGSPEVADLLESDRPAMSTRTEHRLEARAKLSSSFGIGDVELGH